MNSVNCVVIIGSATFYTQNQIFLLSQINALRNQQGTAARVNGKLQKRSQTRGRENVYVAVQVPAVNGNKHIAGRAGKSKK